MDKRALWTHFLPGILSRAADVDLAIGPQFGQSRSRSAGKLVISGRMQCAVSLHGSIIDFVYLCYSLCFSVDNPSFEQDHMPIFGIMNQHQALCTQTLSNSSCAVEMFVKVGWNSA